MFEGYLEKFQNTKGRAGKKRVQVPPPKTVCALPASVVSPFAVKSHLRQEQEGRHNVKACLNQIIYLFSPNRLITNSYYFRSKLQKSNGRKMLHFKIKF